MDLSSAQIDFDFYCFSKALWDGQKWDFQGRPSLHSLIENISFSSGQFYVYCQSYFCFVIAACEHMALQNQLFFHSEFLLNVLTSLDWKTPDLTPFSAQFSLYSCLILHLLRVNCLHLQSISRSENLRESLWRAAGTGLKRHSVFLMDDGWYHRFQPDGEGESKHLTAWNTWLGTHTQSREDWTSPQLCCRGGPPGSE